MRSINNVVDISNYVMLEFGQPLHFFDLDKLGNNIVVRDAFYNEEIRTLDGNTKVLNHDDIVITDGSKPVCIAGVMGGENTEVDENTKNIFIESAIFDPVSIRYTSRKLNLPSEASIRYGKGLNYEYTAMASKRACYLLEKYASGTVLDGYVLEDHENHEEKKLSFYPEEVDKLLGIKISEDDMKYELDRLGFTYEIKDNKFNVTIPKRRLDIDPNVNDIAEEIGRLYGYDNLIGTLPKVKIRRGEYKEDVKYRKFVSKRLRSLSLNEVKTYTLVSPDMAKMFDYEGKEKVVLPNPMSTDKSIVRTSIIPSLINVYEYNKARGVKDISIYEISKTYDKDYKETTKVSGLLSGNYLTSSWNTSIKVDFYIVKGIIENLLDYMGYNNRYSFVVSNIKELHPGVQANIILDGKVLGIIGKIHPNLTNDDIYVFEFNLDGIYGRSSKLKYKEPYKYPSVTKDMAFILDKNILSGDVIKTIKKASGSILKHAEVFDVYEGNNLDSNKKSVAFSLLYNGDNRTLTDEEVMESFNKTIKEVETKYNAILRNN